MTIYAQRLIEVPINSTVPKPYIIHNSKEIPTLVNDWFELSINIDFQDINEFFSALRDLYFLYK